MVTLVTDIATRNNPMASPHLHTGPSDSGAMYSHVKATANGITSARNRNGVMGARFLLMLEPATENSS